MQDFCGVGPCRRQSLSGKDMRGLIVVQRGQCVPHLLRVATTVGSIWSFLRAGRPARLLSASPSAASAISAMNVSHSKFISSSVFSTADASNRLNILRASSSALSHRGPLLSIPRPNGSAIRVQERPTDVPFLQDHSLRFTSLYSETVPSVALGSFEALVRRSNW